VLRSVSTWRDPFASYVALRAAGRYADGRCLRRQVSLPWTAG